MSANSEDILTRPPGLTEEELLRIAEAAVEHFIERPSDSGYRHMLEGSAEERAEWLSAMLRSTPEADVLAWQISIARPKVWKIEGVSPEVVHRIRLYQCAALALEAHSELMATWRRRYKR